MVSGVVGLVTAPLLGHKVGLLHGGAGAGTLQHLGHAAHSPACSIHCFYLQHTWADADISPPQHLGWNFVPACSYSAAAAENK